MVDGRIARFREWCRSQGVRADAVDICHFGKGRGGGRGLVATRPIQRGDVLVSVPVHCVLSHHDLELRHAALLASPVGERLLGADSEALVCVLLAERALKENSSWSAYLEVLSTETVPVLATWSDEALHRLADVVPDAVAVARRQRRLCRDLRARLQVVLEGLRGDDQLSLAEVEWAVSMVASRSVFLPERGWRDLYAARGGGARRGRRRRRAASSQPALSVGLSYDSTQLGALVPFLDMFNHSVDPVASEAYDEASGTIRIVAERSYEAGEEVWIQYGPLSNLELLQHYGFALEDNPHDHVPLRWSDVVIVDDKDDGDDGGGGGRGSGSLVNEDVRCIANQLGLGTQLASASTFAMYRVETTAAAKVWDGLPWTLVAWLQLLALDSGAVRQHNCPGSGASGSFAIDVDALGGNDPICPCLERACRRQLHRWAAAKLTAFERTTSSLGTDSESTTAALTRTYFDSQRRICETILRAARTTYPDDPDPPPPSPPPP